jgi:D-tyrosyl-tRNA(Tyr) deacylase
MELSVNNMRVILQRVKNANCVIDGQVYSEINQGYLLLVGFTLTDTEKEINKIAKKINGLRIFSDEEGKLNRNIYDCNGEVLSISQFTLYADTKKGNRPSFTNAMPGDAATKLYDLFNETLRGLGLKIKTGVFGADMQIGLTNDGPVTIIFEENAE